MKKKKFVSTIEELVSDTPLYHPQRWLQEQGVSQARFFCKLENFNPSGSVKDRTALGMILNLEEKGLLKKGGTILYPTDTVWGIGCDATNADGVSKVFKVKNREGNIPLLVLVNSVAMLERSKKRQIVRISR